MPVFLDLEHVSILGKPKFQKKLQACYGNPLFRYFQKVSSIILVFKLPVSQTAGFDKKLEVPKKF